MISSLSSFNNHTSQTLLPVYIRRSLPFRMHVNFQHIVWCVRIGLAFAVQRAVDVSGTHHFERSGPIASPLVLSVCLHITMMTDVVFKL